MDGTKSNIGLAARLRRGTADAHRQAERAAFIKQFFRGQLRLSEYARFLVGLYPVYEAMETLLVERRDQPVLAPFHLPEMFRCQALAADLTFLHGVDWRNEVGGRPGSRAFAERVFEVGRDQPALLIAHVYTRYLGDLSGGQIMGRVARKALGLDGEEGLSFYRFEAISDVEAFKQDFRKRLDALPVDEPTRAAIIEEAKLSFALNHALSEEVTLAA